MFDLYFPYFTHLMWRKERTSILIVEDDVFLKPMMAKIVYSVDPSINLKWATSCHEAKAALEQGSFDLVISDCLLEKGENGLELWDYCQDKFPGLPFLMISGLSQKSIGKLMKKHISPPPLLHKPILVRECKEVINALLTEGL